MKVKPIKRATPGEFANIKSISGPYINIYDLYKDYLTKSQLEKLAPDFVEWLNSINDFEPCVFYVINGDIVFNIDGCGGSVMEALALPEFFKNNAEYFREYYQE